MLFNKFKDCNKYDIMLFTLIASLAFGVIGGALQVPRLLTLLFIPALHKTIDVDSLGIKGLKGFLAFFVFFMAISFIWTPDKAQGVKEFVYYPVHICLFLEILSFARYANNPFCSISFGWIIGFASLAFIAVQEILTDVHLDTSKTDSDTYMNNGSGELLLKKFAAGTFFNYNDFNVYICYSSPFILYAIRIAKKKIIFAFCFALYLIALYIVLTNASRGSVISLGIFGVICLWDFFSEKNRFRLLGFILFSFGTIVFIKNIDTIFENIMYRMYSTEMLDGSSRYGIWYNALRALVNTGFMGTGIGGLQAEMRKVGSFYDIPITHNMFLEVLTQFGVLIFVPFIIGLYRLVSRIFQISNVDKKRVLIAATLAMPFYFIVNSGYLLSCSFYAYFASLFVFAYITTDNKRCRDRS